MPRNFKESTVLGQLRSIFTVFFLITVSACSKTKTQDLYIDFSNLGVTAKGTIIENLPVLTTESINKSRKENQDLLLRWQNLDLDKSGLFGVSSDKAYALLTPVQKKKIIVAVIDTGVDIDHEDLKEVLWINRGEIAGNGIDDDGNGYVDDIHGWNFLGGKDGSHLVEDTFEETRLYRKFLDMQDEDIAFTSAEEKLFVEVSELVNGERIRHENRLRQLKKDRTDLNHHKVVLKIKLGVIIKTKSDLELIQSDDDQILLMKHELIAIWNRYRGDFKRMDRMIKESTFFTEIGYNIEYQERKKIIGDNPLDFSDTHYGNNDVKGPRATHGTHVAGIIAAKRNNDIGIDGIANNVAIMAIKAIPKGDERDKDIALAIRYAVDNGAHIINMSFGKKYSPFKREVDKAFQYAASRGVMFVHSSGNRSINSNGGKLNFPNSYLVDGAGVLRVNRIPNWFEVGASTKELGDKLVAKFSNYGSESVTLFSPGDKIYSTVPGDKYAALSGTSMGAPVVSGVLSMIWSAYPDLEAWDLREVIMNTVSRPSGPLVLVPRARGDNSRELAPFSYFSLTGGIINAYNGLNKLQTR